MTKQGTWEDAWLDGEGYLDQLIGYLWESNEITVSVWSFRPAEVTRYVSPVSHDYTPEMVLHAEGKYGEADPKRLAEWLTFNTENILYVNQLDENVKHPICREWVVYFKAPVYDTAAIQIEIFQ